MLKVKGSGLTPTAREFYNTVRDLTPNKDKPNIINGLLIILHETGFLYKTRVKIEKDKKGNPIKK